MRAVVNMDMIAAVNTPVPTVLLGGGRGVAECDRRTRRRPRTPTPGSTVQTSPIPFNSDHVPFIDEGIPAVLTIEGADSANDHIHSADDTMQFIDIDLAVEILRMNVAFVVATVGGRSPVGALSHHGGHPVRVEPGQVRQDHGGPGQGLGTSAAKPGRGTATTFSSRPPARRLMPASESSIATQPPRVGSQPAARLACR